jgi:hypothetical protein
MARPNPLNVSLYLARKGDERQAIRSTAGKVEARVFAESWRLIGTVAT